jgi:hypothetical protein
MSGFKYRVDLYEAVRAKIPDIYREAEKAAQEIGITADLKNTFGLTGAVSGCHGLNPERVGKAMHEMTRKIVSSSTLDVRVTHLVKDWLGDEWDGVMTSTCEAALQVCFDSVFSPPLSGRGESYTSRYVAPYERHIHHQAGYGRPFPGRFKDTVADRGNCAGEMGLAGKRLCNLEVDIVPMAGAKYDNHGIKYYPAPLLTKVDARGTAQRLAQHAERTPNLCGFASLGYDTPGYGYREKNKDGGSVLRAEIGKMAKDYEVPYLIDNAFGSLYIGTDPRECDCGLMVYSLDKAMGAATSGLIIGREEYVTYCRRALGTHSERWGTMTAHGKAAYVGFDPGKEALAAGIAAIEFVRDEPALWKNNVDQLEKIAREEFDQIDPKLRGLFEITKSYNSAAVEINYEKSWEKGIPGSGGFGIPIFTIEDMYAGTQVLQVGLQKMGIIPTITYDANIFVSTGLGTTDPGGYLLEKPMRLGIRGMVKLIEITCREIGLI